MKFAFVEDHKSTWPIDRICAMLQVTTSGFYAWRRRPNAQRFERDGRERQALRAVFEAYRGIYGSPRICYEMRAMGYRINHKRVERLMREMGLSAQPPPRFVRTTDSDHEDPIAPNLLGQDFSAEKPDQKWVGDITYIPTREGWLFLAVVIDLFSRRVVGWSFGDSLHRKLVVDALTMAVKRRRPPPGLIFHSDRGCQYASQEFRQLLIDHGIQASMSATGCCYDNAVAESFFHSMKVEEVYRADYATHSVATRSIFAYIEGFYNRCRRHSFLNYLSPDSFESAAHAA